MAQIYEVVIQELVTRRQNPANHRTIIHVIAGSEAEAYRIVDVAQHERCTIPPGDLISATPKGILAVARG